jgi:phthalate 4,5-cis-dihydrodiol dehydrogenase
VTEGPPIALGVAGLGVAGSMMIRAVARHPNFVLRAGADPAVAPREAFARDFGAKVYPDMAELCEDREIEAVYIATPHQFHAEHAALAAAQGKHVILEKPMALTLADCDAIIAVVERAGVTLIVGHTHAFDPNIQAMRRLIAGGEMGQLGMVATWNYTDFLYRPRRPEELDTAKGGGILFNQVPHQIDILRLLGGGLVRSLRAGVGVLDPARPTEGSCTAFLDFADGASASLVYSGYDFFDSDELHFNVSEAGTAKGIGRHGTARRALAAGAVPETMLRGGRSYATANLPLEQPHLPHFGLTIATCERGDLRASADGLLIYDSAGAREVAIPRGPAWAGHGDVLDALWAAVREGRRAIHDARWGKATVEVALAILQSAREHREIALSHQVPVRDTR